MKTIFKINAFMLLTALLLGSCKKDEHKIYYTGGTPPVVTSTTGAYVEYANADKVALTLSWTNPNYTFTTGASSIDVTYNIEIDTVGSNFSSPKIITVSKDLSYTFLVSELNDIMLNQLNLEDSIAHTLEFRVVSSLTNNSVLLASNTVQLTAIPYQIPPKVNPPASGTLYITGSATPAGWMGGGDPELLSQKFTQVTPTLYELTVDLVGGGSYLFVPRYGNWSAVAPDPEKYGGLGANNTNNVNGDDFKAGGGDLLAPAVDGTYKIVVDFQKGKFTVTKQ